MPSSSHRQSWRRRVAAALFTSALLVPVGAACGDGDEVGTPPVDGGTATTGGAGDDMTGTTADAGQPQSGTDDAGENEPSGSGGDY